MKLNRIAGRKQVTDIARSVWREPSLVSGAIPESACHDRFLQRATGLRGILRKSVVACGLVIFAASLLLPGNMFAASQASNVPADQQILSLLNQTIEWYRHLPVQAQLAYEPMDALFLDENRQMARQVLRLSFEFARADVPLLANRSQKDKQPSDQGQTASSKTNGRAVSQLADQAAAQVRQLQAEMDAQQKRVQAADESKRDTFAAALAETESELRLAEVRRNTIQDFVDFLRSTHRDGTGVHGLLDQIDELERSVPEARSEAGQAGVQNSAAASSPPLSTVAGPHRIEPTGILALATDLFELNRKTRALNESIRTTQALLQSVERLRDPLVVELRAAAQRGEDLARQGDSTNAATLEQQRQELDALTVRFGQISAVMVPLGKEAILLGSYRNNLVEWRGAVTRERRARIRELALRLTIVAVVLAAVFGAGALWQNAVFRYVHDMRRRYQFLLLRRLVLGFIIVLVVAFAFASELGSIATFAGFLTAGIAVALQNVILAFAGYFFLIGRYGVRVGDRVQISGVVGDVIDIGLMRLHLMELAESGSDRQPTGRVVVFSNAIVLQPNAGFTKQIPGTNFVWQEMRFTLAPDSDYRLAERRLCEAVEEIFNDYRETIEHQHRVMERTLNMPMEVPQPTSRLRLSDQGLEIVLRYPAGAQHAAQIADRVSRRLLETLQHEPKLRIVGNGTPNIQAVTQPLTSDGQPNRTPVL
jgi:small-conductance mechanosensitive channel